MCFGTADACLRGGTRVERPCGSALLMARDQWIGSMGAPSGESLSGLFLFLPCLFRGAGQQGGGGAEPSRASSHRLIHRFTHKFLTWISRFRWNDRGLRVLLLRAQKVERRTEHGAPATSVAGVYSFIG